MISILQVNPIQLVGLKQAAHVMRSLIKGQIKEEIVIEFGGDSQLVDMWILFLEHNRWMEKGANGRWSLAAKGQQWAGKIGSNGNN